MLHPAAVSIVEVGPRDGLQNESRSVPTALRVRFVEQLAEAGLKRIEVGSFVSPRSVPSMADSPDVFQAIQRKAGVRYSGLVPNTKGLQAALVSQVEEVAVFAAASETFSQRNIQCSIRESLEQYREVCAAALSNSVRVRGYVSCVAGCPYEGGVEPEAVARVAEELNEMGCFEIALGDTIGVGTAIQIDEMLRVVEARVPVEKLAVHFHDTWGQALANILVALERGVRVIDSSAAGLGGCPYAPGATGNVATEDVLYMLQGMGVETGVDLERVAAAGREICSFLKRTPSSKAAIALAARHRRGG